MLVRRVAALWWGGGQAAVVTIDAVPAKSLRKALILELVCGLGGVYGVGNIWAERTTPGIVGMIGFWVVAATASCVNGAVGGSDVHWLVGYVVVWAVFAVPMSLSAARGVKEFNARWASTPA
jgi:hypothetical protein